MSKLIKVRKPILNSTKIPRSETIRKFLSKFESRRHVNLIHFFIKCVFCVLNKKILPRWCQPNKCEQIDNPHIKFFTNNIYSI